MGLLATSYISTLTKATQRFSHRTDYRRNRLASELQDESVCRMSDICLTVVPAQQGQVPEIVTAGPALHHRGTTFTYPTVCLSDCLSDCTYD
jgi:hypothetical protein